MALRSHPPHTAKRHALPQGVVLATFPVGSGSGWPRFRGECGDDYVVFSSFFSGSLREPSILFRLVIDGHRLNRVKKPEFGGFGAGQ